MSISWGATLEKVLAGQSSREEFVQAITRWFVEPIALEPEDSYEAIARRVSWVFDDGLAFTIGAGFAPTLSWLDRKVTHDDAPPHQVESFGPWNWARYANGWELADDEDVTPLQIVAIVEALSEAHGIPRIVLPWGHIYTEIIVDQEEDYFEPYEDEFGDDPLSNPYRVMAMLASSVMDETLAGVSPWSLEFCDPDEFMSQHSDWARFHRVARRVSAENLMFVRLDQYNASTIDESPESLERFVTWGYAGAEACRGNGYIGPELTVEILDEHLLVRVRDIAAEEGFENHSTTVGDEWGWTPGRRG